MIQKKIKIRYKLFIITALFMFPILLLAWFFISERMIAINFGQKEIYGDWIIREVRVLSEKYLAFHKQFLAGETSVDKSMRESVDLSISRIADLNNTIARKSSRMNMSQNEQFEILKNSWDALDGKKPDSCRQFHDAVRDYWSRIGDMSNLILDPDLDSYYLMDVTLLRVPESLTLLDSLYILLSGIRPGQLAEKQKIDLTVVNGLIRSNMEITDKSFMVAFENDSTDGSVLRIKLEDVMNSRASAFSTLSLALDSLVKGGVLDTGRKSMIMSMIKSAETANLSMFDSAIDNLDMLLEARIDRFRKNLYVTLACVTCFVLMSLSVVMLILRSIDRSMTKSIVLTERLSSGDIVVEDPGHETDELGTILSAIVGFAEKIRVVITEVFNATHDINDTSETLFRTIGEFHENAREQAASMEELSATIEEISTGMESLSMNAGGQYENMMLLNSKMSALSETLSVMEKSIADMKTMAGSLSRTSDEGRKSVEKITARMEKINESSERMKGIVGIINDISEQINLLSLNASIEAARAGESGRGFAVVAEEISRLADQTAASIKEITGLITVNDSEISTGKIETSENVGIFVSIIHGIQSITGSVETLDSNLHLQVEKNSALWAESGDIKNSYFIIKNAILELTEAIASVVQSVNMLNEVIQDNAHSYDALTVEAGKSRRMSETLSRAVSFFRV